MPHIGILTGGGDVPGLNSVIKSVVYRASELGWQVTGIRRGWQGLTHLRPGADDQADWVRPLDRRSTRAIDRTGGTMLHTSRTNPARMPAAALPPYLPEADRAQYATDDDRYDLTPIVLRNLEALKLTHVVAIGGDDTLSYAGRLGKERGPLAAIPRAKELINRQRTTLGSHERIGVFRIFGRNAGYSAWYAAYVTSSRCVIPEAPFQLQLLGELLLEDR